MTSMLLFQHWLYPLKLSHGGTQEESTFGFIHCPSPLQTFLQRNTQIRQTVTNPSSSSLILFMLAFQKETTDILIITPEYSLICQGKLASFLNTQCPLFLNYPKRGLCQSFAGGPIHTFIFMVLFTVSMMNTGLVLVSKSCSEGVGVIIS